jgi:hypothetical protein
VVEEEGIMCSRARAREKWISTTESHTRARKKLGRINHFEWGGLFLGLYRGLKRTLSFTLYGAFSLLVRSVATSVCERI